MHDFRISELGRAVPYGVYDIIGNTGWVSVGIDHNTASLAVNAIRSWWRMMGRDRYPDARGLLITADCGGSNGARVRLWKRELQSLADELGLTITVCRRAPAKGTKSSTVCSRSSPKTGEASRWSTTRPIMQLIGGTMTRAGLNIKCAIDPNAYPAGVKVSNADMAALNLKPHIFHGEWNYTIPPSAP